MPTLRPGPYTLQFPTQFSELTHDLEFNCDIIGTAPTGTPPADVTMRTKGVSMANDLASSANALWAVIRPFFQGLTLCSTYVLWKRTLTTTERIFVSGGTLTSPNGSNPGANTPASQATYTFRSGAGGYGKIVLLEGVFTTNSRIPMSSDGTAGVSGLRSYLVSDDSIVIARDRGFAVSMMNSSYGQNEKIFNRRYRS